MSLLDNMGDSFCFFLQYSTLFLINTKKCIRRGYLLENKSLILLMD